MKGRDRRAWILGGVFVGLVVGAKRLLSWTPDPLDELYAGRRPLVLGHRGASKVAPENTLPSFRAALDQGADGFELDAQLSADGVPVVIHDFSLERTTDGRGSVTAHTLAELRRLDAGAWFAPELAGTRIPTLEEVLELARGRAIANVELKTLDARSGRLEAAVVRLVERLGMEQQVLLSSFNPASLWWVWRANPRLARGLLYAEDQPFYLRQRWLRSLARPDAMHPSRTAATREHVHAAKVRGFRVNVWTVDDPGEARRLMDLDVDGIITNRPDAILAVRDEWRAARLGAPRLVP